MAFPFMKNHIVEKNPKVKRSIAIKGPSSLNLILGSSGSLNNALQFGHFIAFTSIKFPQNGQLIFSLITTHSLYGLIISY